MSIIRAVFHPFVFTVFLVALPFSVHMVTRDGQLFPDIGGAVLVLLYIAAIAGMLFLVRRDYTRSGILLPYLVVQYAAVAQFFIVFAIETSIKDSWMLATLALSLPLALALLVLSSVFYIIHRALRARKQGVQLQFVDVAGNASVLMLLLVLAGVVMLLA